MKTVDNSVCCTDGKTFWYKSIGFVLDEMMSGKSVIVNGQEFKFYNVDNIIKFCVHESKEDEGIIRYFSTITIGDFIRNFLGKDVEIKETE